MRVVWEVEVQDSVQRSAWVGIAVVVEGRKLGAREIVQELRPIQRLAFQWLGVLPFVAGGGDRGLSGAFALSICREGVDVYGLRKFPRCNWLFKVSFDMVRERQRRAECHTIGVERFVLVNIFHTVTFSALPAATRSELQLEHHLMRYRRTGTVGMGDL